MGDIFKEQLVKKYIGKKDIAFLAGIITLAVIIFFVALWLPVVSSFAIIVLVAEILGVYYLFSFFRVEYEYIFTNGALDIDVIYGKARRKRLFSGNVSEFELMAPAADTRHADAFSGATETRDYTSGLANPSTFVFLTVYGGKKVKVLIEPNDMMLKAFGTALPSRRLFMMDKTLEPSND